MCRFSAVYPNLEEDLSLYDVSLVLFQRFESEIGNLKQRRYHKKPKPRQYKKVTRALRRHHENQWARRSTTEVVIFKYIEFLG